MTFQPKISVSQFVEQEISIRYATLPISEFVQLIKAQQPLGEKKKYAIEFFREVMPHNREKFRIEQGITLEEMNWLYDQVKDFPAVSLLKGGSVYGK